MISSILLTVATPYVCVWLCDESVLCSACGVCMYVRLRVSVCVFMCVCVILWVPLCLFVCACVRMCVGVRERERESVCV